MMARKRKPSKFRYLYVLYDPNIPRYCLLRANSQNHVLDRYRTETNYDDVSDDYWRRVVNQMQIETLVKHMARVLSKKYADMHKHFRRHPGDIHTMSSSLGPLEDFDTE